ncbi:TetR/AcrR family transcriptional regulator [Saccharomonospora viridis]|jgi:AcrR family transcriptional regulator|uniref:Transcriptional regulator, TetR family n=2 Tax=Saccharomonospora viridis TaxID=1852 RepID=C7MXP6_SACVD|nr:TetR/AcrR family transcriptional regulator [Saccharomonospora viridis]ACU97325.1 transcriptional regulator, TetR family [Saccharomonospora viridis DSM 43017]KHF43598.1 TetR family transcriptional regulator [Saccharomonospora viridis]SFO76523.1 transcriptional regulator, TetR family [Saccharomonospora viridis]
MPRQRRYHHGDLRRAVINAAVEVITTEGTVAISLRDLARRAGVSHAAPAHHFKDKAGLLTAIAIEGYEILADSMQEALAATPIPLPEIGVRYVKFALEHPAHFEVMYRPELYHRDDPELLAAKQWARRTLRAGIVTLPHGRRGEAAEFGVIAAWSLAHGFAVLARSGNLAEDLGEASPLSVFRRIAQRTIPAVDPVSEADGSTTRP